MNLSDRVWKVGRSLRSEMEMSLSLGLAEGKSAAEMSRDVRQYLKEPNKLFRRVRDEYGVLHLSKNAQNYHPGRGVYRSSYKNALRMTATENNMAYRTADFVRWQQLPFVLGIEIQLSNNHPEPDICDTLKGRYPKEFKFRGWHPWCRCFATPITANASNFFKGLQNELAGKRNPYGKPITKMPKAFDEWVEENAERIRKGSTTPYFIKDNFKGGDIDKGYDRGIVASKPKFQSGFAQEGDAVGEGEIISSEKTAARQVPEMLKPNGIYLQNDAYEFSKNFFSMVSHPVEVLFTKGGDVKAYKGVVHLAQNRLYEKSLWHRRKQVYHEFAHQIDYGQNLRGTKELKNLYSELRASLYAKTNKLKQSRKAVIRNGRPVYIPTKIPCTNTMRYIENYIERLSRIINNCPYDILERHNIVAETVQSQINVIKDLIQSVNNTKGLIRKRSYYIEDVSRRYGELFAHCCENKYIGNPILKKLLPNIYNKMVSYVEQQVKIM